MAERGWQPSNLRCRFVSVFGPWVSQIGNFMCGIVGILGKNEVSPILVTALQRLEYRGYDSAGIATVDEDGRLKRRRAVGKLVNLSDLLVREPLTGKSGIGHTRWATHGAPTLANAHPQCAESVAVVHNGIIENFRELRASLAKDDYNQESETDTEVVALLTQRLIDKGASAFEAATETIRQLEGAFALAFLFEGERDLIVAARMGSPLALGIGDEEMFVGSDAIALAPLTDEIVYLEEGDIASVSRERFSIFDSEGREIERPVRTIDIETEDKSVPIGQVEDLGATQQNKTFEVETVRNVASSNSISIYLNLIALEEQVGGFIERVRGSNSLNPDQKDKYLTFLVQLQMNIGDLASSLPDADEELDHDEAEVTASYLENYWSHLKDNIGEFLSPERTAGLTVPLGIVAVSTGVGTIFGQPIVGSILGAWLAGRVSPEKVVGKILEGEQDTPEAK